MRIGSFQFILKEIVIDSGNAGPLSTVMEKNYGLLENYLLSAVFTPQVVLLISD